MPNDLPKYAPHPETGDLIKVGSPEWAAVVDAYPAPYILGILPAGGAHGYALYSLPVGRLYLAAHADHLVDILNMIEAMSQGFPLPKRIGGESWALRDLAGIVLYDVRGMLDHSEAPEEIVAELDRQARAVLTAADRAAQPVVIVTPEEWEHEEWTPEVFHERTGYGRAPTEDVGPAELAIGAGRLVFGRTVGEFHDAA